MSNRPRISPGLVVNDAKRAIDFYVEALGAKVESCFVDQKLGKVVHAELSVGGGVFSVRDEDREWKNDAPTSLGGSPVIIALEVDDAHAAGKRLEKAGAKVLFPIADHFYGERQGRFLDPFGHMWMIGQHLEDLSNEEIQRRIDGFHDPK
jgi:PhnB protein